MKTIARSLILLCMAAAMQGCAVLEFLEPGRYRVTDLNSGQKYETRSYEYLDNGSVQFRSGGATVTIQNSKVERMSDDESVHDDSPFR